MKKNKIAVYTNGWSNEYIGKVLEGIKRSAEADGVDVFVFMTYVFFRDTVEQSRHHLTLFELGDPNEFDGAILLTNTFNLPDETQYVLDHYKDSGVPMVSTEVKIDGVPFIGSGNYEGIYELANHLIEHHEVRRVVYVSGIEGNIESLTRERALKDALAEHGLELFGRVSSDFSFYNAVEEVGKWIDSGKEMPDAFVCANDQMALGVISELRKNGYNVPDDIIVTGFDGLSDSLMSFPMLTTVTRNWEKLGDHAYSVLKEQMEHPEPNFQKIYPSSLVPAESCGCKASPKAAAFRREKAQNILRDKVMNNIMQIFFQNLRISMAKVETIEDFNRAAFERMGPEQYLGQNFVICTDTHCFMADPDEENDKYNHISPTLDVAYEKRDGVSQKNYVFESKEMYPGYRHEEGKSDIYVFVPIVTDASYVGYVGIKNDLTMATNGELQKWMMNLNSMVITIKQYIFAQENNRKLKEIYMSDFLTGTYNRTGCENVIFKFVEDNRKQNRQVVIVFADINDMKIINDKYGHLNGDLALKASADALRIALPEDWLISRYGGDEFVSAGVWEGEKSFVTECDGITEKINKYIKKLKLSFPLSLSIGFSIINPGDCADTATYVRMADEAMYRSKSKKQKL